ncbi:NAD(P)/FAD-dependent oxidoreductase [Halomicrobium salinisoli]|uniref:NAD(P)/FAD-dependent oxidoreductase n=1 Tax=Halomicrobium salinisoli TaxID=2878391 RepID=UPI001CEFC9B8|nr:NAD(P)/FAD-dependent oxidoreductase [Halomicrobium salinisoli]
MPDPPAYEVAVVGGGPAGLTTALYTTRLGHRTAAFERAGGRHAAVDNVHNLLGVSEDVSGSELAELGVRQLEEYGADYHPDAVETVERVDEDRFRIDGAHGTATAERVVLATGFSDEGPDVPGLERFTGRGLHYCLHCDAYTLGDGAVFVLGHTEHAAQVAMLLVHFTDDVTLLTDDEAPEWSDETAAQLEAHPVERVDGEVIGAFAEGSGGSTVLEDEGVRGGPAEEWLGGLTLADGTEREFLGGFAVYGLEYNNRLAADLGCDLADDGAVEADNEGRTSEDGVYAVGDVTHGQNQTPIAMGDGARAGIALHQDLRAFPVDADALDAVDPTDLRVPGAAAELRARMRRDRGRDRHAGLRDPRPGE